MREKPGEELAQHRRAILVKCREGMECSNEGYFATARGEAKFHSPIDLRKAEDVIAHENVCIAQCRNVR